jgi:hypothetical protein
MAQHKKVNIKVFGDMIWYIWYDIWYMIWYIWYMILYMIYDMIYDMISCLSVNSYQCFW